MACEPQAMEEPSLILRSSGMACESQAMEEEPQSMEEEPAASNLPNCRVYTCAVCLECRTFTSSTKDKKDEKRQSNFLDINRVYISV